MPLMRVDYDPESFSETDLTDLSDYLLSETSRIFSIRVEDNSLFLHANGQYDKSSAAAEIEYRVKDKEFDRVGATREEVRDEYLAKIQEILNTYKASHPMDKGFILTMTMEQWNWAWIE